jgi:hypothetical protein
MPLDPLDTHAVISRDELEQALVPVPVDVFRDIQDSSTCSRTAAIMPKRNRSQSVSSHIPGEVPTATRACTG